MPSPELIIVNANIVTMDPLTPKAEALASANGRVTALGTTADINALAGSTTRVINAGGRLVLPGFQDTHIHLQDSGQGYGQNADLSEARTIDELVEAMQKFGASHERPWVDGVGWYTGIFTDENLISASSRASLIRRMAISCSTGMACRPGCCMKMRSNGPTSACRSPPTMTSPSG
jgi:predicted amidohydrolase YtcJ